MSNLSTRFVKFIDQKKSEIVQKAQMELSINSNTKSSQIWINAYVTGHLWDLFYDSKTQLMQFTDPQEGTKMVTRAIYRPDEKKIKKVLKSCNWNFHNDITNSSQINT